MRTPREQFRNAVLEYLSPEAYSNRLSHSANMVTRDQANRTGSTPEKGYLQAGKQIDDLYKTRSDRVSKVQRGRRGGGNSKLNRKGFDDKRAVGEDKPRPATLNLGKTLDIADIEESNSQVGQRAQFDRKAKLMRNRFGPDADPNAGSNVAAQAQAAHDQEMAVNRFGKEAFAAAGNTAAAQAASARQMNQTNKRFQRRQEQFKNAVLNYLEEATAKGVWKAAQKRGVVDYDHNEEGNTIVVNSKSDDGRTTTVRRDPETGEVVVDRHDKTTKPSRSTINKARQGKKLTAAEKATAARRNARSYSDPGNERVIAPKNP